MPTPNKPVSDAALRFHEDAVAHEPWCLDDVDALRIADIAAVAETNPLLIETYVDDLTSDSIAQVPVLRVKPKITNPALQHCRVLYFFGGAFIVGSPDVDMAIISRLAHRLGVEVIAPYYRRAPECPYPAAPDDGFAVYESLLQSMNAQDLVVVGESAGGNLALAVTLRARDQGYDLPAAVALMSPWCDLSPSGESQQQRSGFDPTLDYTCHLQAPAAAYAGPIEDTDPRVSPLYADYAAGFCPTIITTGTRELFLSDCERLAEKMAAADIDVRLSVRELMWHVFEWYVDIPEADESLDEIADFLRQKLK